MELVWRYEDIDVSGTLRAIRIAPGRRVAAIFLEEESGAGRVGRGLAVTALGPGGETTIPADDARRRGLLAQVSPGWRLQPDRSLGAQVRLALRPGPREGAQAARRRLATLLETFGLAAYARVAAADAPEPIVRLALLARAAASRAPFVTLHRFFDGLRGGALLDVRAGVRLLGDLGTALFFYEENLFPVGEEARRLVIFRAGRLLTDDRPTGVRNSTSVTLRARRTVEGWIRDRDDATASTAGGIEP